jgi:hypothetical protein
MSEHQLYLNQDDSNRMVARCACGWQQERQLKMCQEASEVIDDLEQAYERHAGPEVEGPVPHPPLGVD